MGNQSTCMSPSCGITIDGIVRKCPQCGGLMRSSGTIRAFGWVMLVCGVSSVLLFVWMAWTFSNRGPFTGTRDQAGLFVGGYTFVILFCLLASANALCMVVTGRTNRTFVKLMLLAVTILVVGTWLIRRFAR
jgi:hypothetical protein